jgi:hypothetical protein
MNRTIAAVGALCAVGLAAVAFALPAAAAPSTSTPTPTPTRSVVATTTASPAPGAGVSADVCAALTVEGLELLGTQPAVAALLNVTLGLGAPDRLSAADVADARSALGCTGGATADPDADVALQVCAALAVDDLAGLIDRLDVTADVRAALDAAAPALPGIVRNARSTLGCDTGTPTTSPTATSLPTTPTTTTPVVVTPGDLYPSGGPDTGSIR